MIPLAKVGAGLWFALLAIGGFAGLTVELFPLFRGGEMSGWGRAVLCLAAGLVGMAGFWKLSQSSR